MLDGLFLQRFRDFVDPVENHVIGPFAVEGDDAVLSYNYRHSLTNVIEVWKERREERKNDRHAY